MLGDAIEDAALVEQLGADIGELARRLPHELRADAEYPVLNAAINGDYTSLIGHVSRYLIARITAEGR